MAGMKEIAQKAGVSVSTVSNVLNGKKNVGRETRERILRLCQELSYVPDLAAKTLKGKAPDTVLFNFSDFGRSFYLEIIRGISDYCGEHNYDFLICTSRSCERYMKNHSSKGCILLDKNVKSDILIEAASENYPIIVMDRCLDHPYIKSVVVDNSGSMKALMEYVCLLGYRSFGFVGGPEYTADNMERYEAFLDTLTEYNLIFLTKHYFVGDYTEKSGYRAAKIMMLSKDLPEVIICANDNMAVGVIKAFRDHGIRVPEDVGVTGFDHCEMAESFGLTTVDIPNYERGYIAARYLIESIEGRGQMEEFQIAAKLVVGTTTTERVKS